MNLIILNNDDSSSADRYRLNDHRAEHIRTILKAQVGDNLQVGLVDGPVGIGTIIEIDAEGVLLTVGELRDQPAPIPTIDLICALPRPQTLKKVLAVAATMAVRRIHLIRANRVEKSFFHSPLLEPTNYTPYLLEGCSQGKQTRLPTVTIHQRFRPFLEDALPRLEDAETDTALRLICDPESKAMLNSADHGHTSRLVIAIGPEGGWVPFEVEQMTKCGFVQFTLGRWMLRVESAVTAALAQVELIRNQSLSRE